MSQGLVCTVTTVNSHLPCAALSPFIPRMELCQGLPSGLRAIHVVSRAQALWAPPSLGRKGGLRARCRPRSGWAVPRQSPSRARVSGTVASTPPVGKPRSCWTAVLGGAPAPGQPAATRPSTERPWSPSCRAWAKVGMGPSHPQGHLHAQGSAFSRGYSLGLGAGLGEPAGVPASSSRCRRENCPHSSSLSAFETGCALKTRFSHLPESLREHNCPQAEPELLTALPEAAAANVYSASL